MRETKLNIEDLIYPLYAAEDIKDGEPQEIKTMPGQFRYSINDCVEYAKELESKGLKMVIVFGIPSPEKKDEIASPAYAKTGIVQRTVQDDDIGLPQEFLLRNLLNIFRCIRLLGAAVCQNIASESVEQLCGAGPYTAKSDDAYSLALEL